MTNTTTPTRSPMPNTIADAQAHLTDSHGWSSETSPDDTALVQAHRFAHGIDGHPELADAQLGHAHSAYAVWPAPATGVDQPPAPPAKRKIGRYIAGGVVALFIVAGIAGSGDTEKDAASSDGVVTTPTTASTPAATATISMAAWASRYGAPDASQIGDDLTALQGDAEAMDLSSMASSCRTMQRHVATAKSHLPTPDAQLTSALRSAYGYYDQAMTVCISGAANMDVADLTQMTSYISMATGSLQEATARMDELN